MVLFDEIAKAIEDELVKCKKPYYSLLNFPNMVKHTMNLFADETKDLDYEKGIIINNKGEIVHEADGLKTTGTKNEVYIGELEYFKDKMENEWCADIIQEYREKKATGNYSYLDLKNEYEDKIIERLQNLGSDVDIYVDHNHPNSNYILTCLSEGDIVSLTAPLFISDFTIENTQKSITAEASNGSRMTLINKNGYKTKVSYYDVKRATENLHNSWSEYVNAMYDEVPYLYDSYDYEYFGMGDSLNKDCKKASKKIIPKFFKDNIKEFEDLGFELRIDWL